MPTPGVRTAPDEAKLGNGFEFVYTLGYEACSIPVLGLDSHELRGDSHVTHESVLFPNCKDILNILDRKVTALQGRTPECIDLLLGLDSQDHGCRC